MIHLLNTISQHVRKYFFMKMILLLSLSLISETSNSRTWYIKPDGTGDAPTIQAGIDSSIAGDSVLVAPGVYSEIIDIKQGICLISEFGPDQTKIIIDPNPDVYYAIGALDLGYCPYRTEINGFWVEGVKWGLLGAISIINCENTWVLNNILTGNSTGIMIGGGNIILKNNTCYGNNEYGIDGLSAAYGLMWFNIIWDRARFSSYEFYSMANDFLNISDSDPFQVNNFSQDPEFCGAEAGNFYLQSDSPCAPGNPPFLNHSIGALPVNCGNVSTEDKTWGEIKAIYRK